MAATNEILNSSSANGKQSLRERNSSSPTPLWDVSTSSPTPLWDVSTSSPPQPPHKSHRERTDSDEIFVDFVDNGSQLSLSEKRLLFSSTHCNGKNKRHIHLGHDVRTASSVSSSASSLSMNSSLASISEDEMLTMLETMPPCDCDDCLLLEPDASSAATRLRRQSSWRKIRSFIQIWSPFNQVFRKHKYPWIQLAGHQGNFHAGEAGSVLKKLDSREQTCFQKLMSDSLKDFVPEYRGNVEKNEETYIQLQDLLCTFSDPCVMDIKMGVRTYLEEELRKARLSPSLRKDMYQKMIEIDCSAPTTAENEQKAVTKPRYMQWRDEMSSSVELGFRVEGIKKSDGNNRKDFKKTKTRESIVDVIKSFVGANEIIAGKYIRRLKDLMRTQETSEFFLSHEIIGSSLLFVHDGDVNVGVWMIDFGKSEPLPKGVKIDHRSTWNEGNHEDGYLFGLDNLISIFEEVEKSFTSSAV